MSILKKKSPQELSLLVDVAVEMCKFANGRCECMERGRRICDRAEFAASKVVALMRKHDAGA